MASRISAARVQALEREQTALALRREGKRYDEIADQLGLSTSGAWSLVRRAFKRSQKLNEAEADYQRTLDLERLDAALSAIWPQVESGKLLAVDRLLGILERRAKLLGLDRAQEQKVDVGDALAAILAKVAAPSRTTDD
jgi:hypothetical protein